MKNRVAKRRPKARALVRGEPVVRGVLGATLAELAEAGYRALRIEDVAARAGVNKTTVYRRWPTKEELVREAILSIGGDTPAAVSSGSIRTDLLEIARRMAAVARSPERQGLFRMFVAEGPDSELMAIARSVRKAHEIVPRSIIEAAEARGELAPGIDPMLLFDVLVGAVHHRLFLDRESVDEAFLHRLVDLLLLGALAPPSRKPAGSRLRSRTLRA